MFPQISVRRFIIFTLLLFAAAWSRAAEVTAAPQVIAVSPTSVSVRWRTDVPTGTRVNYGLAADRLNHSSEGVLTDAHEVTLSGLQTGTKYFFAAGTARKQLATGQFTTSVSPSSASAAPSTSPASAPATTPKPKSLLAKILAPLAAVAAPKGADSAPPTRQTWGSPASLADHFARHGGDFGARSADDYAAQAWRFRQRAQNGALQVKIDDDGVQRVFDPASGAFAAYNRDGTTKTFFKPGSPGYFDRQPGRPVRAITP
ncbi:MAG: fibronectin type III domain-containing protein [Chthoniobacteraceae bacterium]